MRTALGLPSSHPFLVHFEIGFPPDLLPFPIPDLGRDVRKFCYLSPELARQATDPVVFDMWLTVSRWTRRNEEYLIDARRGNEVAWRRLLKRASFPEPHECGLGYSRAGKRGHGAKDGSVIGRRLMTTLRDNPAFSRVVMEMPDTMSFIPQFGIDRITDLIITLCKSELIYYTQQMVETFGFSRRQLAKTNVNNVWQEHTETLVTQRAFLPIAPDGAPIILVPGEIVRSSPPFRPNQYARIHGMDRLPPGELKRRILDDNRTNPARLEKVIEEVLSHPAWIQPRKEFRSQQ